MILFPYLFMSPFLFYFLIPFFFITLHILGAIEEEIDYACLGSELTIYKEFLKLDQGPHEVH